MEQVFTVGLFVSVLLTLPALAAESLKRPYQTIPVYSVSPGATGGISGSVRIQKQDLQQVPGLPNGVFTRNTTVYGTSGVQQSGGLRQSVEYPNGMRVPQQSVQRSYQLQRDE
jgi:hypothetical protein